MDARALAAGDERAATRVLAWEALGKWVKFRVLRQRGVHVPNLFYICFQLAAADENGSRLRRPVFVLSERFADNFRVKQAGVVEKGLPAPANGDDLNFYQLAIQHSEGLSKDQVFGGVREMMHRFGDAAKQGREIRLDLGAGTLISVDREITFEFTGGIGAGGGLDADGERERVSHLDPMLGGRDAHGGAGLEMHGQAAGAAATTTVMSTLGASSAIGASSALAGSTALSAEEEAALFRDVDALDPETQVELAAATMRAGDLEAPTQTQLGHALQLDPRTLGDRTVEELGAALGARAAALEARIKAQRAETDRLEQQLLAKDGVTSVAPTASAARAQGAAGPSTMRAASRLLAPTRGTAANAGTLSICGSAGGGSVAGSSGGANDGAGRGTCGGASSLGGSRLSASSQKRAKGKGADSAPAPPVLSVGFASGGPVQLSNAGRQAMASGAMASGAKASGAKASGAPPGLQLLPALPVANVVLSDKASSIAARRARSGKVPTAPPLPPFRYSAPEPNDAANRAWKHHAAPHANSRASAAKYGRAVGGPAPPFLAAPPQVAAAMIAKAQGRTPS